MAVKIHTPISAACVICNPDIEPVFRKMAQDRFGRMPDWTENHSHSYGSKEDQVRTYLGKPGPE